MSQEEDFSFEYDENSAIDDDEVDSILSGENGKKENRKRNIPDLTLHQLLTKKRKFIHFFFRKITIISFFFTFIYNIFWIIIMKTITIENKLVNFVNFRNNILKVSYFVIFKAILILFIPQICCGSEKRINDFSYSCVFLKSFTTFGISLYLTSSMGKKLDLDKNYNNMDINNRLYYWINLYYLSERYYIKGIISLFIIIISLILIKIGKESWKAIKYSLN